MQRYATGASQVQSGNVDRGIGRMFQTHAEAWLTWWTSAKILYQLLLSCDNQNGYALVCQLADIVLIYLFLQC